MLRSACVIGVMAVLWAAPAAAQIELSVTKDPAPPVVTPKALDLGAKPRSLSLARVGDSMKHGQPWAVVLWGRTCSYDSETNWDASKDSFQKDAIYERVFRDELAKLGFNIAGDPNNLFKGDEDDGAELQVGALVTDISVLACGGLTSRDRKLKLAEGGGVGAMQMAIEWQIYSPVESKVVARVPTVARLEAKEPQLDVIGGLWDGVFAANVRALAASDSFRAAVLSPGVSPSTLRSPVAAPPIALQKTAGTARPLSEAPGSVVVLFAGDGMGSGFLVSRDGHLLTNRHVVGASKFLKVKWSDGVETVGEVVRSDLGRDVALVKTDPRGRQPFDLRRNGVQTGETVFAIGSPLDPRLQGSLTQGVVSANRVLHGYSFIQSDVVVNPGNSGGPLLDQKGAVVGVTVSGVGQKDAPRGINFFIPIEDALAFLSLKPSS